MACGTNVSLNSDRSHSTEMNATQSSFLVNFVSECVFQAAELISRAWNGRSFLKCDIPDGNRMFPSV